MSLINKLTNYFKSEEKNESYNEEIIKKNNICNKDSERFFLNSGTEKSFMLSDDEADDIDKIPYYIKKADMFAIKLNQTTNIYDFFILYKNIENILEKYIQYEKYGIFKESTPSKDLKKMRQKKVLAEKALIDRCIPLYKDGKNLNRLFSDLEKNIDNFSTQSKKYINRLKEEYKSLIDESSYHCTDIITHNSECNSLLQYNLCDKDDYFIEAGEYLIKLGKASIGMLQRQFKIGFNRASKIMDELYEAGVVEIEEETRPRKILLSLNEFNELCMYYSSLKRYDKSKTIACINESDIEYHDIKYQFEDFDSMSGLEFEKFCSELLIKNRFYNVQVTQGSGDHGIDILAEKDGITYAIQCKCYSSNIGNAAIQQAHTGKTLYHRDIAVVLTNRYFTQQAIDEATELGVKLWNRDKLHELIKNAKK